MNRFRSLLAAGAGVAAAALAMAAPTAVSARGGVDTLGYTLDAYGGLHPLTIAAATAPAETAASVANHKWSWKIARGFAQQNNHTDGVVLDGWGGLHGWGTDTTSNAAPAGPFDGPYWPGWDIARAVVLLSGSGSSGYVLDGWGGVHSFGTAPNVTVTGYWPGWDIARGITLNPGGTNGCTQSGFVLDGWGGVHPFATTDCTTPIPTPAVTGYWAGWDIARGIVLDNDDKTGNAGYVLDGWGGMHPFSGTGTMPAAITSGPYWKGWDIARAVSSTGTGTGYILDGWGGVHGYGGTADAGVSSYTPGSDQFRDLDLN